MKYNISILSAFILSILISSCNNKEKSWSTSVLSTIEVSYNEVVVQADYNLYRNKNYVNVGICVSEEANPDINNKLYEDQLLDSDHIDYTIENLF